VYNGGVAGSRIVDQATFLSNGLIPATPDILFLATAFNDTGSTASAFVSDMRTFITSIRASYPNAPIVITTENVAGGTYYTAKEAATRVILSALAGSLLGTTITLPLSTTFIESTTDANVWILDTKQAFNYTLTASESHDGLHPNSVGYTVEADWIFASLTSTAGTSPTITTNNISTIIQGVAFSQTLTATGTGTLTWALSTGSLPDGLTISASGILAGTPRAFGDYDFTLSVTNTVGTNTVRYTGTITNPSPSSPFGSNTTTKYRYRMIGQYYPLVAKVKTAGTFKKLQGFN
jgi:lysophospholipase L1-like esterase